MSKTFDEGGAKGLLLANLGSSLKGCNIVFDSTLETEQEETSADVPVSDGENNSNSNIAFLQQKLESHLNGQPIHVLSLVPQLKSLRQEFASLEQEGHVEALSKGKKQYAAPQEEELVADRSIHLEAIERSRASQAELGRSLMDHDSDDDDGYGPVDLGGNNDFDDGEVDEFEFGNNTNIHDGNHRFSSSSFQQTFEASQPPSQATMLLDALATGEISFSANSSQEFFSSYTLESLSQKNLWAGAAHWKKIPVKKPKSANNEDTSDSKFVKSKKKAKPKHNVSTLLRLLEPVEDLDDIMRKPPKSKKKGVNPLQLSKTMLTKHAKNDNLLPEDAGLALQNLSSLFMRPTLNLAEFNILTNSQQTTSKKHVGFGGIEFDDYDDHDNDGPGFEFGGGDDSFQQEGFVMPELEGIRKVNKVHVGYATVAKKVDVKRLKKDLWQELHQRFETMDEEKEDNDPLGLDSQSTIESSITSTTKTRKASLGSTSSADPEALSFQDTIQKMKSSQTQSDVTLPFYFICVLHLANEKGLALESQGLQDFIIHSS
jgi:condensin complex subunit 2